MRSSLVMAVIAAVIGLAAGFAIGFMYLQPTVEELQARENEFTVKEGELEASKHALQTRVEELKTSLADTAQKLSAAEGQIGQLRSNLSDTELERSRLETLLSTTNATLSSALQELTAEKAELEEAREDLQSAGERVSALDQKITSIKEAVLKMGNDRLLLIELRKDLPDTREEVIEYWNSTKRVAVRSDPSLGPAVDKIMVRIDAYFGWLERQPGPESTLVEYCSWLFEYGPTGAFEYDEEVQNFRQEVLLVLITRIDMAVTLVS